MRSSIPLSAPDAMSPGGSPSTPRPTDLPPEPPPPKIRSFESKLGGRRHEDQWSRTPNSPGTGAIHVKTFHAKLNEDSMGYLDQQINEWLDAHPQYEVKFVTTSVGAWAGKLGTEQHLVLQVWV